MNSLSSGAREIIVYLVHTEPHHIGPCISCHKDSFVCLYHQIKTNEKWKKNWALARVQTWDPPNTSQMLLPLSHHTSGQWSRKYYYYNHRPQVNFLQEFKAYTRICKGHVFMYVLYQITAVVNLLYVRLTMGLVSSLNGFSPIDQISKRTIPKLQTSLAVENLL